jgi:two-component system, NarL family, response regulator NreC
MSKIRLMLVEDHTVVRCGLRALFDRQPDMQVVAETSSAKEALALADQQRPDVLILDLTLPAGGSLDVAAKLRSRDSAPGVLVLTMHDDPAYARAALAAGASGYVVKTVTEQDLLTAVRSVVHGRLIVDLDDEDKTACVFGISPITEGARTTSPVGKLSARESEVLALLGEGRTNQAIAELLDINPKTVATYRARIGDKLGLRTTADFVKYASAMGLDRKADTPTGSPL